MSLFKKSADGAASRGFIEEASASKEERPASRFEKPALEAMNREHMSVGIAIDHSISLSNEAMRSITSNLNRFKDIVCKDKMAAKCVDVCVVAFSDKVEVVQDWCPISEMRTYEFHQGGNTDLNGGVLKAAAMIREHSAQYSEAGLTEKKPYLIVMTDGMDTVTGSVDEAAEFIVPREREGKLKTFFLGFDDYDRKTAAQLTAGSGSCVFEVTDGSYDFSDFFDFAGNSTKTASVSALGAPIAVDTPIGTADSNIAAVDLSSFLNR